MRHSAILSSTASATAASLAFCPAAPVQHARLVACLIATLLTPSVHSNAVEPDSPAPQQLALFNTEDGVDVSGGEKSGWALVPEILSRIIPPKFQPREFVITEYGAAADGKKLCTESFRKAIEACANAGGGRVVVPKGQFLTGPIHLKSDVELHLADGAEIVFSDQMENYLPPVLVRVGGIELYNYSPLIYARDCRNIAVTGSGTLNGNAKAWWEWARQETRQHFEFGALAVPLESRVFGKPEHRIRPSFVSFMNCENILLEGFTIGSGPNWTIHPIYCRNTTIRGVTVQTDGPNNDGIDPDSCRDILIEDCTFDTGDDCIVLKSGYNQDGWRVAKPTENVVVRKCRCNRGHGGLVIGSEMSGDVRNVFMEDCQFEGTDRVVRIKSRADRGGVVEDVFVRNITAKNMQHEVILLTMDYTADKSSLAVTSPPVFRDMHFEKIRCQGSPVAVQMQGMLDSKIRNIAFRDLEASSNRGIEVTHAQNLLFENVRVEVQTPPVYNLIGVSNVLITGDLPAAAPAPFMKVAGKQSGDVVIRTSAESKAKLTVAYGAGASESAVRLELVPPAR